MKVLKTHLMCLKRSQHYNMKNQDKRKSQNEDSEAFVFIAIVGIIAIVTILIIIKNI